MGRLAGFQYRKIIKRLKSFGFGDIPEGTLRAILKEADINPDDFLKKK